MAATVVQGRGPRLAHGGPGELGGDPVPAAAGLAERFAQAPAGGAGRGGRGAGRGERPGPPGRAAPGGGHHPDRGPGRRRAGPSRRGATAATWSAWSRRPGSRRPRRSGPDARAAPVLAQAGVVDAGGAGYLLLLDALLHVVDGRPLPEARPEPTPRCWSLGPWPARRGRGDADGEEGLGDLRYEVMYLLEAPDDTIADLQGGVGRASATRSWWSGATGCGTATSTPTTSGRRSRRPSTPGGPGTSG